MCQGTGLGVWYTMQSKKSSMTGAYIPQWGADNDNVKPK